MFTQCPSCSTVYEVSATDLSVGRGKVRCGFCETTFDALVALSEDAPLHGTTLSGLLTPELLRRHEDRDGETGIVEAHAQEVEPESAAVEDSLTAEPAAAEYATTDDVDTARAAHEPTSEIAAQEVHAPESPAVENPAPAPSDADIPQEPDDTPVEAQAAAPQAPPDAPELAATSFVLVDASATSDASAASDAAAHDGATSTSEPPSTLDLELLPSTQRSMTARIVWGFAATLLTVALAVQIVHRSRDQLLMQPAIASYLQRIYAALGLELDPHWEVARYKVIRRPDLSTERSADGGHAQLHLAATIMNGATRPQPYPLIRLTLEDRWGSAVAGRDFAPSEYLRESARATGMLAPGEHVPVDLVLIDPGADTVGFTIDICLADASGTVRCASDATGS